MGQTNRCFLCEGSHLAGECTTYPTLEERENAVETLKLCLQCLQPTAIDHGHLRAACMHCGKAHHKALCPREPWRRGTTCAFCLGYHHSNACDKYMLIKDRIRAAETLKLCRRCLSRSHLEDDCTSTYRCKRCQERHHHALCPNAVTKDADEIEAIRVVRGSMSTESKLSSNEKTQVYRRKKRQKAKRRAGRERDSARKARDDAQDKCKALEKRIHDLENENRNCEAIRQVTAAAVEASIEIVTNREEVRRRTIEKERDDAARKLLEAEKRIEALKKAASDAVRLTLEFQAWRIRALIRAKKSGTSQKESRNNREDGCTMSQDVSTDVQKSVKDEAEEAANDNARKRPAASSAPVEKRRRTDSVKPPAEELNHKLDAVLHGYSECVAEKYRLFFVENLRGTVTIEELVQFVSVRCPSDVDLANSILNRFTTSP